MSRQVSRGSAGDYQADEQAGVARRFSVLHLLRKASYREGFSIIRCGSENLSLDLFQQMERTVMRSEIGDVITCQEMSAGYEGFSLCTG